MGSLCPSFEEEYVDVLKIPVIKVELVGNAASTYNYMYAEEANGTIQWKMTHWLR